MARKTWIKVKRGLLEAKHVKALGIRFPYYLLLIDWANWECGAVLTYRDKDAADELEMPIRTIRDWRQELVKAGYIECVMHKDCQTIRITKWINPREYSGQVYNDPATKEKQQGFNYQPSKGYEGDTKSAPPQEKGFQGDTKGDTKTPTTGVTPSMYSQNTEHNEEQGTQAASIDYNKMIKTIYLTFMSQSQPPKLWEDTINNAPKRMNGTVLEVEVDDERIRETMNRNFQVIKRGIAMARFPFGFIELVAPPEEEGNNA